MSIQLLIIQATPFCNIDCKYCYLDSRNLRSRMSMSTLRAAIIRVLSTNLVLTELSIVWHAGEPLTLPVDYYETAFAIIRQLCPADIKILHSFQSNGMLINDEWCQFILKHTINIGLSIDGPAWLHDKNRITRNGKGTHKQAMLGFELLKSYNIPFHIIAVITDESLKYPDEIFGFFLNHGVKQLCFNIEEIEAKNITSTLNSEGIEQKFRLFFERILFLMNNQQANIMRIREIDDVMKALLHPDFGKLTSNTMNTAFEIINVAYNGDFSTFSPELLGIQNEAYANFSFGNLHTDDILSIINTEKFQRINREITQGVIACQQTCKYFSFCRGGAPSNKLAELGSFSGTETLYCRLTQKTIIECVLYDIESRLTKLE